MKYVATEKGFYGDRVIEAGEEFEADGLKCSWAEPVKKSSKKEPGKKEPEKKETGKDPAAK